MLDINQSSMNNFDTKKMYHFIAVRFKKTSAKVQGQALSWLQVSNEYLIEAIGLKILLVSCKIFPVFTRYMICINTETLHEIF